jgi:hypothetical protein
MSRVGLNNPPTQDMMASINLARCFSLRLFIIFAVILIIVTVIYTISIPEMSSGLVASDGESVDRALFYHKPATIETRPLFFYDEKKKRTSLD